VSLKKVHDRFNRSVARQISSAVTPKTIGDDQEAKIFLEGEGILIMGSDVALMRESGGSHNGNAWLIRGRLARDLTASNQFAW